MADRIDTAENRTPRLPNAIKRFIDRALRNVYTMIPGRVEEYDAATQRATVQPLIRIPIPGPSLDPDAADGDLSEDLPQLTGVPIIFPRSTGASIYWPIYPGTFVMLIFSMYSLEKFLAADGTGTYDPQDGNLHSLSDAVAIPGLFPREQVIENLDDDDARIILESQHGKRVEIGLGGDTGDFFAIPDNLVQLGAKIGAEAAAMGESNKDYLTDEIVAAVNANHLKINAAMALIKTHVHPGVTAGPASTGPSPTLAPIQDVVDLNDPGDELLATKVKLT
jgi:hypothetical protein